MKCLQFILAIGLILPYFTGSVEAIGINLNETFTKLCGFNYVQKIYEICGGWPWKALLPHRYDPFQPSGDHYYSKKKDQRIKDIEGHRHIKPYDELQVLDDDDNLFDPMPDDSNEYVSETEGDSKMVPSHPKADVRKKLIEGPLSKKCCETECTTRDMERLC